jgi:hypothetical protein
MFLPEVNSFVFFLSFSMGGEVGWVILGFTLKVLFLFKVLYQVNHIPKALSASSIFQIGSRIYVWATKDRNSPIYASMLMHNRSGPPCPAFIG